MARWQAPDPLYSARLPRDWFRTEARLRLPESLPLTLEFFRAGATLRLLGTPSRPTDPSLDALARLLKDESVDRGQGRVRWPNGASPESVELSQALDGSYQLQRSGLRGTLAPVKGSKLIHPEAALWFCLGRLVKLGGGEQALTLIREGEQPGLLAGTLALAEEQSELLPLRDGPVAARRFRYRTVGLGYPKERERGKLWIGEEGEVLKSDLLPNQLATGALRVEKGSPAFRLALTDGSFLRAEQTSEGWKLTDKATTTELGFDYRLRHLTSKATPEALQADYESGELRYAYPGIPPRFVRAPEGGALLLLTALLAPEPLPGLAVGQKRPVLFVPLITGDDLALEGSLSHLPDPSPTTRRYQLALSPALTVTLDYDTLGLVRLSGSPVFALTRK